MEKSKITYAQAIAEVEQILERFNNEQMNVDELGAQVKRAAELIRGGRVMVNHRPCGKADKAVEAGDVLTFRGLGKCVLREIGGTSKRGRTILELERYL